MNKCRPLLAASLVALVSCLPAGAQTIVNWGAFNGSTAVVNNPPSNSVTINGGFSSSLDLATPRNPAVGSTYNTDSPVFFGAVETDGTRSASNNRIAVTSGFSVGGVSQSAIQMWSNNATTYTQALFWKREGDGATGGFLNGYNVSDATLTGATLQLNPQGSASTNGGFTNVRFVISLGGSFYVSNGSSVATSGVQTFTLDPLAATWSLWDPNAISGLGGATTLTDFGNLTGIGFIYTANRGANAATSIGNSVGYFNATAVPEPTTYALAAMAVLILVGGRLRRRALRP